MNDLLNENIVILNISVNPEQKYILEDIEKDHDDYKLLETCLNQEKTLKIYRVVSTDATEKQSSTSEGSKLLLLHGTKGTYANKILKSETLNKILNRNTIKFHTRVCQTLRTCNLKIKEKCPVNANTVK